MKKDKKAEFTRLPFEVEERIDDSLVTAHAGVPLVIELFRATGAAEVLDESVKIKSRKRGLTASEMAESLFALWASGGDQVMFRRTAETSGYWSNRMRPCPPG